MRNLRDTMFYTKGSVWQDFPIFISAPLIKYGKIKNSQILWFLQEVVVVERVRYAFSLTALW